VGHDGHCNAVAKGVEEPAEVETRKALCFHDDTLRMREHEQER
jgi:hypothetical protein